jgi:hypothetical protein
VRRAASRSPSGTMPIVVYAAGAVSAHGATSGLPAGAHCRWCGGHSRLFFRIAQREQTRTTHSPRPGRAFGPVARYSSTVSPAVSRAPAQLIHSPHASDGREQPTKHRFCPYTRRAGGAGAAAHQDSISLGDPASRQASQDRWHSQGDWAAGRSQAG